MKTEYKLLLSFIGLGVLMYLMNKTLNITIKRKIFTDNRTIGELYVNGEKFCDTLEDTYRVLKTASDKVQDMTAIPNGLYSLVLSFSNKFQKKLPEILNVPFFTGIRIHTGTNEKDTSGCILVGDYKNGVWIANPTYVQKLNNMLSSYQKATINIMGV